MLREIADAGYAGAPAAQREGEAPAVTRDLYGSFVETRDEFEKLLALTDPALVAIGLDTGHLAYGGGDPVDFAQQHARRIKALHLKDVYPNVLAEARRQKWGYHDAQAKGLWAE